MHVSGAEEEFFWLGQWSEAHHMSRKAKPVEAERPSALGVCEVRRQEVCFEVRGSIRETGMGSGQGPRLWQALGKGLLARWAQQASSLRLIVLLEARQNALKSEGEKRTLRPRTFQYMILIY